MFNKIKTKVPFYLVLILPFVTLIIIVVSLASSIAFKNGQKAVGALAHQLQSEITLRIYDRVQQFLETPTQINKKNASFFSQGILHVENVGLLEDYFWQQVHIYPDITSMYFGNNKGGIIGAGREGTDGFYYKYRTANFIPGPFLKFRTDDEGKEQSLLTAVAGFDSRDRPWYASALSKKSPTWSDIYFLVTGQDMALAASQPVYTESNEFIGVISVDIFLSQLQNFLQELPVSPNGISYIMERSGYLVASSAEEPLFQMMKGDNSYQRLKASESESDLIRASFDYLEKEYGDLYQITDIHQLVYSLDGKRHFLEVSPYRDGKGIDWLIVVTAPESDFMGPIQESIKNTSYLILLALGASIGISLLIGRWMIRPITKLNESTNLVAGEAWETIKPIKSRVIEIDNLAKSFSDMSQRIKSIMSELSRENLERQKMELSLRESEDRYRTLMHNVPVGIFRTDCSGKILTANKAFYIMFGFEENEVDGFGTVEDLFAFPEDAKEIIDLLEKQGNMQNIEIECRKINNELFWASITCRIIPGVNGEQEMIDGLVEDITSRKLANDRLRYIATHDLVTQLPNRALFEDRLGHAIHLAERSRKNLAVLLIDLDNFKAVNDAFGHKEGDHLLKIIGARLDATLRESDTVARFGGDEFTILLENIQNLENTIPLIERILLSVSEPVHLNNAEVFVTCSIGIATYPTDGITVDTLIQNADHSLYRSKDNGKNNFQFFSAEMKTEVMERLELKSYLRNAIEKNELDLYYQPLMNTQTDSAFGVEALIRWRNRKYGFLTPDKFISIAEETGLIVPIGQWVLKNACQKMQAWLSDGWPLERITVNLSYRELKSRALLNSIKQVLFQTGLPANILELELSENMLFKDPDMDFSILQEIKNLGVRLSVDDFGTGYTTLSRLADFPFDTLKIDQHFTRNCHSGKDASVVKGIVTIAQNLDLDIIAEGVETKEQLDFYHELSCTKIQGYYFSKPLPAEELEKWFWQRKKKEVYFLPNEAR